MTARTEYWRLLIDTPADGAWNMAVDEAILDGYTATTGAIRPPTLRLYGWRPAALSLGKSQPAGESHDAPALRAAGVDLVRRPTGGWAVLHDHERTYALTGPLRAPSFASGVLTTYRRVADALILALGGLGVEVGASGEAPARTTTRASAACFTVTSAYEITAGGRKLVGSAQLRRRGGFLQHGSIPIRIDAARLAVVLGREIDAERFTDLGTALGRIPDPDEVDRALCAGFSQAFDVKLRRGRLTADERLRATRLRAWKHLSAAWVVGGKAGRREAAWGPTARASSAAS
ncbi:MAG TPA: lipoate--protein ligase family protein [Candidatus Polarisedimenticolaceae bacterium]|nr:lipoate--protein ligase family protein [Candidatus Polarisedimenticolaceae bacterium]